MIAYRKNAAYRMQLAIVQNPHTQNPDALWKSLTDEPEEENVETRSDDEVLDKSGFSRLINAMSANPRIQIKR